MIYYRTRKILFIFLLLIFGINIYANCSALHTLTHQHLYFYSHSLGFYTIFLNPTLMAIADHEASPGKPYYKKKWWGDCPNELSKSNVCFEFTVYPNSINFSPDPMEEIKKYNHGHSNRGEVRVLANHSLTKYVYTIDHEKQFCGPYHFS